MEPTLNIYSIYNSIDGEVNGFGGIGELTTFIRFQGCNLRCSYCDTKYAQSEETDSISALGRISIPDIISRVNLPKVTITGGEPLMQEEGFTLLVRKLLKKEKRVTVETNGTYEIPPQFSNNLFRYQIRFVLDFKFPEEEGKDTNFEVHNFSAMCRDDVLKFVIRDRKDYDIAVKVVQWWKLNCKVAFSPMIFEDDVVSFSSYTKNTELADWIIEDSSKEEFPKNICFSLQLHKILWPDSGEEH